MKNIILITASFPYFGGEQFLETEIKYYLNNTDINLTLLPLHKTSEFTRDLADEIKIDTYIINKKIIFSNRILFLIKSLKSKYFYKEIFSNNLFNFKKLKIFFSSISMYQMYYEYFDNYFKSNKDLENTILYTYWNNEATYALQSLKDKYQYKLISRIHGGDLYKERKPFSYMPLKKHFIENIDVLYTITQSANNYLEETYGFSQETLRLARLGVEDRKIITKSSPQNSLNIVSCSFLTEVKQVDKIIESLKIISSQMKDMSFTWTHIGDGILSDNLISLAKEELYDLDNIKYDFVGNYSNEEVYKFYKNNRIDVFINISASEGVPVSIMEAMSCHIPIIAPDIGGVSDMIVNGKNGFLLSGKSEIDEIVICLSNIDFLKKEEIREQSYSIFLNKYNADKNYKDFSEDLIK